ncbi:MAG: dihydroxyacetone kinase subunit DhaL [Chloroflexota bacterium]|nr:dihydroxyacetone kinase subunit DhaL [Chloroflexota bacterium]
MPITTEDVLTCLHRMADVIEENKKYLTKLDSAIGDADHGINMARGFKSILKKASSAEDKDAGTILKTAGMALVSSVGGAGGPLYGTAFMQAGMAVAGKHELEGEDVLNALRSALQGVIMRGKASPGDKTMVDAITPAVDAMEETLQNGADTAKALEAAAEAARQGMEDTIPMLAKKGRASYLGERSIGHQDPGATSSYLLIQVMADMAHEKKQG